MTAEPDLLPRPFYGEKTCFSAEESTQSQVCRAWNEGFDFARRAAGWQEGEDPATEGSYIVRDSKGNVEVAYWYEKTFNSQPAEWSRELVYVDRDDIVAWIKIPPYGGDHG